MPIEQIQFELGKQTIAALSNNNQGKPLLILVHGWLDNAASFSALLPELEAYHAIAIDLPGHGLSSHRSPDAHYHLLDYVNDLHNLVEQNGWDKIALVGHSLGGIISSIYSASFPEKVSSFVCIESAGPLTEDESTTISQIRGSIESRIAANGKPIKQPNDFASVVQARRRVSDLCEMNAETILRRNVRELDNGDLEWTTDKRLRTQSSIRLTSLQAENIVKSILCPIYVVLGESGFEKVKKLMKERQGLFQNLQLTSLKGGHHVHMESVKELAIIIKNHCQLKISD